MRLRSFSGEVAAFQPRHASCVRSGGSQAGRPGVRAPTRPVGTVGGAPSRARVLDHPPQHAVLGSQWSLRFHDQFGRGVIAV
ncbi:hypothetical protein SK571_22365 [Lentzea sp. BCCO 10_0798]|uniref:Uncharacterized protein n=1 Tax=Lentzea kristufekii TaxID=3095430 RepID=A0ABU4TWE5_9PSEU|nr:hypothetical protein [Lentzea sp. BCCO 10_0798]MDX8052141.1 hypothetical protein [Lentzea sp. BCCO 10_0798]